MKKIILIVGARPNFMKAYPVYEALKNDFELTLIHTGQHFDAKMSDVFFNQLGFPVPDIHLNLESKSRAGEYDEKLYIDNLDYLSDKEKVVNDLISEDGLNLGQLGEIRDKLMGEFEKIRPELVIVFGDVTSTLSAGLAAKKLNIEIAHIESGLRSGDLSMPEEVNRILTDSITKYFFVTEPSGVENLKNEGIEENVYLVGNTMIDCLYMFKDKALETKYCEKIGVIEKEYVLITLHRPANVDDLDKLKEIFDQLFVLSEIEKLVYPIHPRTKINLGKIGYLEKISMNKNIILEEPLGYLEFTCLEANAKYVITDSGGIQEETTALGVPCFTLRPNTERPVTLIENGGTNQLINSLDEIRLLACDINNTHITNSFNFNIVGSIRINYWLNGILNKFNSYNINFVNATNIEMFSKIKNAHFLYKEVDFLFKYKENSERLIVFFHGAIKPEMKKPIFYKYSENFDNSSILCISDPILKFFKNLTIGYYLSTNIIDTKKIIFELVSYLKKTYKFNEIIFMGSSAGGNIAIFNALKMNAIGIILNSYIEIDKHYSFFKCIEKELKKKKNDNFRQI